MLKYGNDYLIGGWIGVLFFGGGLIFVSRLNDPSGLPWLPLGVLTAFVLFFATLICTYCRCRLVYVEEMLHYQPLWGKPIIFLWKDVKEVTYNRRTEGWRLRLEDGRSVRVAVSMHGAVEFMQTLAQRGKVSIAPMVLRRHGTLIHFPFSPNDASMRRNSPNDHA